MLTSSTTRITLSLTETELRNVAWPSRVRGVGTEIRLAISSARRLRVGMIQPPRVDDAVMGIATQDAATSPSIPRV